jgi:tRNA threonylcarbamoyladenosine biosynthesis protein TsaB
VILAIKTAGMSATLALLDPAAAAPRLLEWEPGRELSTQLLAKIQELLHRTHTRLQDLTGIIVFSGPGSFTSLRIGHSVANALADSLGIPVVGSGGDGWLREGAQALAKAKPGRPALPVYGAEAHITKPRA